MRYNAVIASTRLTLASAFRSAGWRTALVSPADESDISPVTAFYRYDALYDGPSLGYRGPNSGMRRCRTSSRWPPCAAGAQRCTAPPLMAEVDHLEPHALGPAAAPAGPGGAR